MIMYAAMCNYIGMHVTITLKLIYIRISVAIYPHAYTIAILIAATYMYILLNNSQFLVT